MRTKVCQLPLFERFSNDERANYMKTLRGPYSQAEFAGILQTDPSVVDNWERGTTRPRANMMRKALEHYKHWAIQLELPRAASLAASAAHIKKHLTSPPSQSKQGKPYPAAEQ